MKKNTFLKIAILSSLAIPLSLSAQSLTASSSTVEASSRIASSTTPITPIGGNLPSLGIGYPRSVTPPRSNLRAVPQERRDLIEGSSLGKTIFFITEELLVSSMRSESLIARVETFVDGEEKKGTDVSLAKVKLDEAKSTLSLANTFISALSSSTESFANELSTSTYKKAVRTKRVEFRKNAEDARANIKKTNRLLREIVTSFVSPAVATPSNPGIISSASSGNGITSQGNATLLTPPAPPMPLSTSTKKTLLLEQ